MLEHLIELAGRLGMWGYVVVFGVVALECQALFGLFMPGESLVMASGFLAAQGYLDWWNLILVAACAAIVGDSVSFELGRRLGRDWLMRPRKWSPLQAGHLRRVEEFFASHGAKAVFAGHFMHIMRALMPFVAGTGHMRYGRFLIWNAAGCVAWATMFVSVGYFAGASWGIVARWFGRIGALLLTVVIVLGGAAWWWRRRKHIQK